MTDTGHEVVVGVDTHQRFHHAVVVDGRGGELADQRFPANGVGYAELVAWAAAFGQVVRAGVEGTGSYGAGLTRHLHHAGWIVVEVNSPDRQQRRLRGKTDRLDALHAARAAQSGLATVTPKRRDGHVEMIRLIRTQRRLVVKQNTETMTALRSALVTVPDTLRSRIHPTSAAALAKACLKLRPRTGDDPLTLTAITVLNRHARTWQTGHTLAATLLAELKQLITQLNPDLLAEHGVGPDSAAALLICAGDNPDRIHHANAFAMITGTAPIPASSGKTHRYRLNRGGDRQANAALHRIIIVRLKTHPETRAYRDRALARGKTRKDAIRLLKRYLARRLYPLILNNPQTHTIAA